MPLPGRLAVAVAALAALLAMAAVRPMPAPETGILPIGAVQGPVPETAAGDQVRSPYAPPSGNGQGRTVTVHGVIYQKTLARTSGGGSNHGFFLQNTSATADADPTTSDGIFVFHGSATTLP